MADEFWHIQRCSLFTSLTESQLEQLEKGARLRQFDRGEFVYLPADSAGSAFLLAEGRIRICSSTPDGKVAILGLVEPGELFGELSLIDESARREDRAEAAVRSTVILLPGETLRRMMEEAPHLAIGVTRLFGLRRRRIERRLRNLLFRSTRERLQHLLLELTEQYGRLVTDGVLLDIRLSHQELASVIGATRESITLTLGELQALGLIMIHRRRIILRNLKRLSALCEVPVPPLPASNEVKRGNS